MKIRVINGPNINFTGIREKGIYGAKNLQDIENEIMTFAKENNIELQCFQSNHEGGIIDYIQQCYHDNVDGIVINPGAYTHYSYAIRDAIAAIKIPCIEVHISNVFSRDEFRSKSVIAPVCKGSICGFGFGSYYLAVIAMSEM